MEIEATFLSSLPYFAGLSPDELNAARRLIFEKKLVRGDVIVFEGDSAEALYFVGTGAVKLFLTSTEGKEQVLNIARPGDSFNDIAAFDGGPSLAGAQAMGPVTVYGILKDDLIVLLQRHPQIAVNMVGVLAVQVRRLVSLVEDLSFRPVVGRVAKILLEYAGDGAGSGQRLTQQDMAAIVGTAREVVSRSLRELHTEGVIRLDRNRIVITDEAALRSVAGVAA